MKKINLILIAVLMAGCANEQISSPISSSTTSQFDQSWLAAKEALLVHGVRITQQDRDKGILQGVSKGVGVSAFMQTQDDGSVRVEFKNTSGTTNSDPKLIRRITKSYDSRMER
jgi:hypothetical protein